MGYVRFRIQEVTTYSDEYEVEAETKEEAITLHRAGLSWGAGGSFVSDSEIVDVFEHVAPE